MSYAAEPDEPVRRRRWRFSLLGLLGAVAVVGAGLSAFNLFVMRPWRDGAVRELVEAVEQHNQGRVEAAIVEVKQLGAHEQAAAELAPLLQGTNWTIRSHAAHALASLDHAAAPALVRVIERQVALEGEQIRDSYALAAYVRCLQTPDAVRRICEAARQHPGGGVRGTLIHTLAVRYPPEPPDSPVRDWLVQARGGLDSAAAQRTDSAFEAATGTLRETFLAALADVAPSVRASGAGALGASCAGKPGDGEVWSALTNSLQDDDLSVRIAAASGLAAIDQRRAAFALPTVLAALESPNPHDWLAGAYAVRVIDPTKFLEVWPALQAALRYDDRNIPFNAVFAIESFGGAAAPAVPELIRILDQPKAHWDLFSSARRTLTTIGVAANDVRVEDFYLSKVGDADWKSRALWELIGFARKGSSRSLQALTAALEHEDAEFRIAAASCLGLVGPPAKAAVPNLQNALRDEDEAICLAAVKAIAKINAQSGAGQGGAATVQ